MVKKKPPSIAAKPSSESVYAYKLNHWVLRQLRAQVLNDIKEFVPIDAFDPLTLSSPEINDELDPGGYLSMEHVFALGAHKLNKSLVSLSTIASLSARQTAAAELLLDLGLLASHRAKNVTSVRLLEKMSRLKEQVSTLPNLDSNRINIEEKHLEMVALVASLSAAVPTIEQNITLMLTQYANYLSPEEFKPFASLLVAPLNADTGQIWPTTRIEQAERRIAEEKAKGTRSFKATVAREFGVSPQRLSNVLKRNRDATGDQKTQSKTGFQGWQSPEKSTTRK